VFKMAWFNYGYTHSSLVRYIGRRKQDSNVDLDDDDMSRLQEIAPADYMDYRRPEREDTNEREFTYELDRAGELMERDYYEQLEQSRDDPYYPDRYSWDQYAGGDFYRY